MYMMNEKKTYDRLEVLVIRVEGESISVVATFFTPKYFSRDYKTASLVV